MPQRQPRLAFVLLCAAVYALVASLALPRRASANMAAPQTEVRPGDRFADFAGELRDIHIEHETLNIDLRPLADARPALVEANYQVRNDGDARALTLLFVAGALAPATNERDAGWVWRGSSWVTEKKEETKAASNVGTSDEGGAETGVWLDGQRVASVASTDETAANSLPESWRTPAETPRIEGRSQKLPYEVTGGGQINFRVTLAHGTHAFRVRYRARPTAFSGTDSSAIYWQLAYVLAPARDWASFGGLEVKVLLPPRWRAAAVPDLRREGDTLSGSWRELPADALALTVQTSASTVSDQSLYWKTLFYAGLFLLLASAATGWLAGRILGARRRTWAWTLPLALVAAMALTLLAALLAAFVAAPDAPNQAAFNYNEGYSAIFTLFLIVVALGSHFIVALLSALVSRHRVLTSTSSNA